MTKHHRIPLAVLALLIFAAGSCAPSPRLSRSTERSATPEKASRKAPPEEDRTGEPASREEEPDGAASASEPEPAAERIDSTAATAAEPEEKAPRAPREARGVARRALVLRAVGTVAFFPRATEATSANTMEYFNAKREKLVADLKKEKLWGAASKNEQAFLSTPVGTRSEGTPIEAGEVGESLLVALWALGLVKRLPEFDTPSPGITMLSAALPAPEAPVAEFVNGAELRPRGEIDHAKLKAFFWNWRAQVNDRLAEGKFPQGEKLDREVQVLDANAHAEGFRLGPIRDGHSFYRELIRFTSFHAAKEGLIPNPIHEDFPVKGKGFAELTDRERKKIAAIAAGRLHALEWMRGDLPSWDSFTEKG